MLTRSLSYRKLTFFFLLWCSCWIVLQSIALQSTFEFGWYVSVVDAVITNLVIAICGYDMILVMKYYRPKTIIRVATSVGLTIISVFAINHLSQFLIPEHIAYAGFMERSLFIRGLYIWLMIVVVNALTGLWFTMLEQQESDSRNIAAEKLAREAELSRLRQQLQPHFLFNSLNSISALAGSRPEEARKMIHQLSDFLRGTLQKDDQQLIVLGEEMENLSLYLEIEKVRFGHRLKTEIKNDEHAGSMKIPSLLLQPVVENAIKFGLYDTLGETVIRIRALSESRHLKIIVENPFDPSSAPPRSGTGFGLNSIQRRLYLLYARNDLMTTSQNENIFTTTIIIPQAT